MDRRYIAGFFDGEGCVYISKHRRNEKSKYWTPKQNQYDVQIRVTISNTNKEVLYGIQEIYGGSIQSSKQRANRTECFTLHLAALKALRLLKHIKRYAIVRRNRIEKAIWLQEYITKNKRTFIKGKRGSHVSKEEWMKRHRLLEMCRDDDVRIEDIVGA